MTIEQQIITEKKRLDGCAALSVEGEAIAVVMERMQRKIDALVKERDERIYAKHNG